MARKAAALLLLLRDLAASGMSLPDIRDEAREDRGTGAVCAWIGTQPDWPGGREPGPPGLAQ